MKKLQKLVADLKRWASTQPPMRTGPNSRNRLGETVVVVLNSKRS